MPEAESSNRFYVNVDAVQANVSRIRAFIGPHVRLLAMVKALAYGSDATRLSLHLQDMGVDYFGVSSADEGTSLREAGVRLPILVMQCAPDETDKLLHFNLTPVLYSVALACTLETQLRQKGRELNAHIEIDTGLGRLGIAPGELPTLLHTLQKSGCLHVEGILTHFASAEDPDADEFTRRQIACFEQSLSAANIPKSSAFADHSSPAKRSSLDGRSSLLIHAAATSGAIRFPEARYDMVRIGLGLFGLYPSPAVHCALPLVPAVALVSRIAALQTHCKGDRIGYNGTFTVPRNGFRKAVLPIGYHDGIPASLSNQGYVLINGQQAPICGRISMDSMMVNVTDIPEAEVGMDALLYGYYNGCSLRPEHAAQSAQTIVYELLTRLGPRVQRRFVGF